MSEHIRVAGVVNDSITDGPGLRLAIFMQGCDKACPGCHNESARAMYGGQLYSAEQLFNMVKRNPLLSGVTLSGGEPLLQAGALLPLALALKAESYSLAVYTGYTLEEILASGGHDRINLLKHTDTLVDGPFMLAQRDLSLKFKGSKNQRILDARESLRQKKAVVVTEAGWM